MSQLDRRTVLKTGGVLTVGALTGCSDVDSGTTSPSPTTAGSTPTPSAPDWNTFSRSLNGRLFRPGQSDYPAAHQLFNPRWDTVQPAGVVRAADATDVQKAVNFARQHRLACVPKCGGHSYVGASTVGNGLMIDLGAMNEMTYANDALTVGGGARLYDVHVFLDEHGRSLPTGTCPTVGVAGLALGGGMGVHTRTFGLTCDRILSMDVITADGVVRNVGASSDADLFWALRGSGGGNLGIVTAFRFATIPATKLGVFRLTWPESNAAAVVQGWQKFAESAPITSWGNLHIDAGSNGTLSIHVLGISTTGSASAAAGQLESLVGSPASARSIMVKTHLDAVRYLGGGTTSPRTGFIAGSDVLNGPMDTATITALLGAVKAAARANVPASAILDPLGGQAAKEPAGGSSWPWRSALGVIQWYAGLAAHPSSAQLRIAQTFLDNGHRAVGKASAGGYVNYVEAGRAVSTYYGASLTRLRGVKQEYDPGNFFHTEYTLS